MTPLVRGALVAWVLLVAATWGHLLDDAFIHLRYAANLWTHGALEYTVGVPDRGASSPLWVALLAPLEAVLAGGAAAKVLSVLATVAALALTLRVGRAHPVAGAALLVGLCAPSAVRWLPNGMETPLVVAVAVALGLAVPRVLAERTSLGVLVLLVIAVLLRIEFLAVAAALAVVAALGRRPLRALEIVGATALGLGILVGTLGAVLPDTAVAKSLGLLERDAMITTAVLILKAHLAAPLLAGGVLLAWLISARALLAGVRAVRISERRPRWLIAAAINGLVPALVLAAVVRGQVIHGLRYFVWLEVFVVVANLSLARTWGVDSAPLPRISRRAGLALAALFVLEAALLWPVFAGRSATSRDLLAARWDAAGASCIAAEIGAFGYATGCAVLDPNGLVNGAELARLDPVARMERIGREDPRLLFLSPAQFDALNAATADRFAAWQPTGLYRFPNIGGFADPHHVYRPPRR